jgi:hypothetical protein
VGDPHVMLDLRHVLLGRRLLGERPGQHELGFEDCSDPLHDAVQGRRHPGDRRMLHVALDVGDQAASVALIPGAVELLCGRPQLYDEVIREVLGPDLPALFLPKAD